MEKTGKYGPVLTEDRPIQPAGGWSDRQQRTGCHGAGLSEQRLIFPHLFAPPRATMPSSSITIRIPDGFRKFDEI